MFLLPHVACKLKKKHEDAKVGCHRDDMSVNSPVLVVFWFLSCNRILNLCQKRKKKKRKGKMVCWPSSLQFCGEMKEGAGAED